MARFYDTKFCTILITEKDTSFLFISYKEVTVYKWIKVYLVNKFSVLESILLKLELSPD